MKNYVLRESIERLYEESLENGNLIMRRMNLFYDSVVNNEELSTFHPKDVSLIKHDDEYFCGIRANTFVVMYGWTEHSDKACVIVQANHKGSMWVTAFYIDSHYKFIKE